MMFETLESRPVLDLEVDRHSPVPVYVQISDAIRTMIRSGELPADSLLPPSQQLCNRFGITRMTLRQAYNVLEREGLIDAQRGRGTGKKISSCNADPHDKNRCEPILDVRMAQTPSRNSARRHAYLSR